MMNCIIVDDEYKSIELLKDYVKEIPALQLAGTFRNPVEAFTFVQQENIELLFLDINMPRLTGIDFVKALPVKPLVIFTTAYSQHAVEGFELDVVDYLLKPIAFNRFLKAVRKAQDIASARSVTDQSTASDLIYIKSGPQTHVVKRSEILYIEKDGNYCSIQTSTAKIIVRLSFSEMLEIIGSERMARINKSFIISIDHITLIESNEVMIHKTKIPIGAQYRAEFLKLLGIS